MFTLVLGGIHGAAFNITREDATRLYDHWRKSGLPEVTGRPDRLVILLKSDHAQIIGPAMMRPEDALALIA